MQVRAKAFGSQIAALTLVALAAGSPPERYVDYVNARFAFRVDRPASLKPGPEPANGDGLVFASKDGKTELRVFGRNNIDDSTVNGMAREQLRELANRKIVPAMVQQKGNWYAVSWIEGREVRYVKAFVDKTRSIHLNLRYPVAAKKAMAPVVTQIVRSFQPLAGPR